jgi:hypothetical protein
VNFPFSHRPLLLRIIRNQETIMSAQDDLKAAIARLSASTSAELKAIADKLASLGDSVTSADVESAVAAINTAADTLDKETADLTTPPATP